MAKARPKLPTDVVRSIWSEIPGIECKGFCWESCAHVVASKAETEVVKQFCLDNGLDYHKFYDGSKAGERRASEIDPEPCPYLKDKRCSIHEVRPSICRMWGVHSHLPCAWGCKKPKGNLSDAQAHSIVVRLEGLR